MKKTKHGLYFKGIMKCDVCGLTDCPFYKPKEYCHFEIEQLKEIDEMSLIELRTLLMKTLAKDLYRLALRIRIRAVHTKKVPINVSIRVLEMLAKYITASKGKRGEEPQIELWKLLSEKLKEEG